MEEIIHQIFKMLSKNPTDEHKKMALKIYKLLDRVDVTPDELGIEKFMAKLGIVEVETNKFSVVPEIFFQPFDINSNARIVGISSE